MNKQEWIEAFETINGRKPLVAELGQAIQNGEIVEEQVNLAVSEEQAVTQTPMSQQDWVDYFEMVNGRKPSVVELNEAKENGEIVLEQVGQTSQVAQSQPSATMSQQEWVNYFELVNNRKPTVAELQQAMANGEMIQTSNVQAGQQMGVGMMGNQEMYNVQMQQQSDNPKSTNFLVLGWIATIIGTFFFSIILEPFAIFCGYQEMKNGDKKKGQILMTVAVIGLIIGFFIE